jgi:hypothetical protein
MILTARVACNFFAYLKHKGSSDRTITISPLSLKIVIDRPSHVRPWEVCIFVFTTTVDRMFYSTVREASNGDGRLEAKLWPISLS